MFLDGGNAIREAVRGATIGSRPGGHLTFRPFLTSMGVSKGFRGFPPYCTVSIYLLNLPELQAAAGMTCGIGYGRRLGKEGGAVLTEGRGVFVGVTEGRGVAVFAVRLKINFRIVRPIGVSKGLKKDGPLFCTGRASITDGTYISSRRRACIAPAG